MRIETDIKYDFSDVLIKPKRSEAPSREHVDLLRTYEFRNSGSKWDVLPIIASNMTATGTFAMAQALAKYNMLVAFHKYYSLEELWKFYDKYPEVAYNCFYTVGINPDDFKKLEKFTEKLRAPLQRIAIDVANGYTKYFVDYCKKIRDKFPKAVILAGNVCTAEMVQELIIAGGVDIVKIGIGPGSVCKTRVVTGCGYPQLSAIIECADAAHGLRGHVCADGGCSTSGDVVKAFAAGADFVMLGGMFSGCDECEGEWTYDSREYLDGPGGKKSLKFFGMSSKEAMEKYSGGKAAYRASEGACVEVPYKGLVSETVDEILGGLRSACTLVGADKLKDLSKCTTFIRVNRVHSTPFG